jgi:hypothetical protein
MWNPFRRKPGFFPRPEWPPIQQLDSIDIVGKRKDGGVDLAIVASQPVDNSVETLCAIRQKVNTYLATIGIEEFQSDLGYPPLEKTTIILLCEHPIHPEAAVVIDECKAVALAKGVGFHIRRKP